MTMRKDTKKLLDSQLNKKRNYLIYGIIALIFTINLGFLISVPATSTIMNGTMVDMTIDTSKSSKPLVTVVMDSGDEVVVKFPNESLYVKNSSAEYTETVTLFGSRSYEFNQYIK